MVSLLPCIVVFDADDKIILAPTESEILIEWKDVLQINGDKVLGVNGLPPAELKAKLYGAGRNHLTLMGVIKGEIPFSEFILTISRLERVNCGGANECFYTLCFQWVDCYYLQIANKAASKFKLTKAEKQLLIHTMMGLSVEQIQLKMSIGTTTLRTHQQRLRQKLGTRNSLGAALTALHLEQRVDGFF